MCAHSWQLFKIFNVPIAIYSEQAQEHWNKFVGKYKSGFGAHARQHNLSLNISDIFSRMLVMTHPLIASKRQQIVCSLCEMEGHSCKSTKFHSYGPAKLESIMIEEYYNTH